MPFPMKSKRGNDCKSPPNLYSVAIRGWWIEDISTFPYNKVVDGLSSVKIDYREGRAVVFYEDSGSFLVRNGDILYLDNNASFQVFTPQTEK